MKRGDPGQPGLPLFGDGQVGPFRQCPTCRRMVAIVGELLTRLQPWKTSHDSVPFHGSDFAVLGPHHPLAPLHGEGAVAPVADGDVIDEGMRLLGGSRKLGIILHTFDGRLESR